MSQQARNNPDSPEMQRASRDNDRAVFAAKMMAREHIEPEDDDDSDDDEPTVASERSRWLDGVDNGNRDYI